MAFSGLDHFVRTLESKGQLIRITQFVDPKYEIAEITDRVCKQPHGGKALLFENTGTSFPVLTNAFGSDERIALALGISSPDEAAKEIEVLFKSITSTKQSFADKIRMLPTLRRVAQWMPKTLSGKGECQQVIHTSPNLSIFPILTSWPYDGGLFVTLPMVNTKDPKTGIRNVGMYRMQVFDDTHTGMHWHRHKTGARHYEEYRKRGEKMPIAVALGGDPVYTYAATAPLPDNLDEYLLAGFLRGKPVRLVKAITVDIEVPYDADIVIEGYVDTKEELAWEGPFGDHTGFYSLADWYPKFHVTCITHKHNAIYPATVVGVPPMEDVYLAKATERIFLSPIKIALLPEVIDMYLPEEGVAHNLAIVKIDKTYPGQAYKVASALWGAGQMMFNKILIVVDGDVDIRDVKGLLKNVASRFDPKTDFFIGKGPLDVLDHSSSKPGVGGKLLIDATAKYPEELDLNKVISPALDADILVERLTDANIQVKDFNASLALQGISVVFLSVDKGEGVTVRTVVKQVVNLLSEHLPKVMVFVDKEIPLNNSYLFAWYASGNVDPERDCFAVENEYGSSSLIIDGTRKSFEVDLFKRDWPNIVISSSETIHKVNTKWKSLGIGQLIDSPSEQFSSFELGDNAIVKQIS